ncbi:MAG TPA: cupin, partial [Gammaproteobacteria bacterium]
MRTGNLYAGLPAALPAEEFSPLLGGDGPFRLQRIVSTGQASAPGEWYDQADDEWVVLLRGAALLRFADRPEPVPLAPGDWL